MPRPRTDKPPAPMTPDERYSAYRVGYWARVHDLTLDDVMDDVRLQASFAVLESFDADRFMEGWQDADAELKAERLEALHRSLEDC